MAEMTNRWNAREYDAKHAFVYEKAKGLVDLLAHGLTRRTIRIGSQLLEGNSRDLDV